MREKLKGPRLIAGEKGKQKVWKEANAMKKTMILMITFLLLSATPVSAKTIYSFGEQPSIYDYLVSESYREGGAKVAVIGSSVARGKGATHPMFSWFHLLEKEVRERHLPHKKQLSFHNFSKSGYTLNMLLGDGTVDKLVQAEPDLVMIETGVVNSYQYHQSIDETKQAIKKTVAKIKEASPHTKILFISPNPTTELYNGKVENKRNHTYQDYLQATEQFIKENHWPYIDIYRPMAKRMADSSIELEDTLADGVHPNNIGYYIWFQVMNEYFNQPVPW